MRSLSKLTRQLKHVNHKFKAIQGEKDMITIFCEEHSNGSVTMGDHEFKDMRHFEDYLKKTYAGKDLTIINDDLQPDKTDDSQPLV